MIIVGIDPGLQGGVAIIQDTPIGHRIEAWPMPTIGKARKEIDTEAIWDKIPSLGATLVVIEEPMPAPGRTSVIAAKTIGIGMGRLLERFRFMAIERPSPNKWKNALFGAKIARKKGQKHKVDPKAVAIDYVRQRWPEVNLRPGKRTKDHDGIADAICLAEYGRRLIVGAPS